METFTLNNGTIIPAAGIGTFMMSPKDAEEAVFHAFTDGYTMVDTANAYMNEKAVGRGITRAGVNRKEIYVSTKLWPSIYTDAANAIDSTLKRLGTDYIDLLFLHQPVGDVKGAYRAMEDAVKAGKVRSLGLSNFSVKEIREIAETEEIKPAVIQVEAHPYYPQTELKEYLKTIGAVIMAWYPLGHGDKNLVNEPVFTELGKKYSKSNAQIILRWHIQSGHIVIPGSRNPQHIRDNIDLFDFSLTPEDMAAIAAVNKNKRYYTQTEAALQGYLHMAPDFDAQE
ncbi:MAG: aldo/keto reductase [Bilifractor sp.]|jgi:diketogulonate reductase-like aldo/keto reductase